jgi:Fic family protein
MQGADFTADAPGRLVRIPEGGLAFVPDPLPPKLVPDTPTANLLAEARGAVGELAGIGRQLPNPHLLIGPFLRREAITSSRIEGTIATAEELTLFEAGQSKPPSKPDVCEVANYVRAMEHGLKRLDSLPICSRFIRELHEMLLKGVRGQEERPGEFRTVQNMIGRPAHTGPHRPDPLPVRGYSSVPRRQWPARPAPGIAAVLRAQAAAPALAVSQLVLRPAC